MLTTNPLCLAVHGGHIRAVKLLIESGAKINDGLLHHAIEYRQREISKLLIDGGADVNIKVDTIYGLYTPLRCAVCHELIDMVRMLLEAGAIIDVKISRVVDSAMADLLRRHGAK